MKSRNAVSIAILLALPLSVQAEPLNVKTGLWETTWTTETRGLPPLPKDLLDKLSPEQRKKMEADLRAEQAKGPDTETDRECITKKDLERPFEPSNTKECKHTTVVATRTAQEIRIACTGGLPGSGTFKVTAANPQTLSGSMDLKLGEEPQAMTIKGQFKARWLGEDCGDEADEDEEASDESSDERRGGCRFGASYTRTRIASKRRAARLVK